MHKPWNLYLDGVFVPGFAKLLRKTILFCSFSAFYFLVSMVTWYFILHFVLSSASFSFLFNNFYITVTHTVTTYDFYERSCLYACKLWLFLLSVLCFRNLYECNNNFAFLNTINATKRIFQIQTASKTMKSILYDRYRYMIVLSMKIRKEVKYITTV